MSSQASTSADTGDPDPRTAAVTFVTTEHFSLQGARAATIAESTGRATMFLGSVAAVIRVQRSAWRQIRRHAYFDSQQAAVPPAGSE
jgi:hypothetical protein